MARQAGFAAIVFGLTAVGCSSGGDGGGAAQERLPIPSVTPSSSAPGDGPNDVRAVGWLHETAGGAIKLCSEMFVPCSGIEVLFADDSVEHITEGPVLLDAEMVGGVLRAAVPSASGPSPFLVPPKRVLDERCERQDSPGPVSQVPEDVTAGLLSYVDQHADLYAGRWLLGEDAVLVVSFVGDATVHRAALEELSSDSLQVCVLGGARLALRDLVTRQDRLSEAASSLGFGGSGIYQHLNVVWIRVSVLDPNSRRHLEDVGGDSFVVVPFVEFLSDDWRGDESVGWPRDESSPLITVPIASGGSMTALGILSFDWDAEAGCLYAFGPQTEGRRILPVWPAGYTLDTDVGVFDSDDELVAPLGEELMLGGGFVALDKELYDETCSAFGVFIIGSVEQE